jgi:hypothetical protein
LRNFSANRAGTLVLGFLKIYINNIYKIGNTTRKKYSKTSWLKQKNEKFNVIHNPKLVGASMQVVTTEKIQVFDIKASEAHTRTN